METTARSKFCRDLKLKDIKPCLRFLEKLEAVRPELAEVLHPVLDCLHLFKEVVDSCFSWTLSPDFKERIEAFTKSYADLIVYSEVYLFLLNMVS